MAYGVTEGSVPQTRDSPNNSQIMQESQTHADQVNWKVNPGFSLLKPLLKEDQGRRDLSVFSVKSFPLMQVLPLPYQ